MTMHHALHALNAPECHGRYR